MNDKYKNFTINHFPLNERFYPMHDGKYIRFWLSTNKYELQDDNQSANYENSEEKAIKFYDKFLEFKGFGNKIYKPNI